MGPGSPATMFDDMTETAKMAAAGEAERHHDPSRDPEPPRWAGPGVGGSAGAGCRCRVRAGADAAARRPCADPAAGDRMLTGADLLLALAPARSPGSTVAGPRA